MTTNSQLAPAPVRLETKSAAAPAVGDPVRAIADRIDSQGREFGKAIEGIKTSITTLDARQRLAERKGRVLKSLRDEAEADERDRKSGRADPLRRETMRRHNAELDDLDRKGRDDELERLRRENRDLQRKAARPAGPDRRATGHSAKSAAFAAYRQAANLYLKHGQTEFNGVPLRELERKALSGEVAGDGGFFIHPEQDTGPLEKLLVQYVPMRQHATVRQISAASLKKPVSTGGASASWVGERETRSETASPDVVELEFPAFELYAKPKASQQLIEDASIDIEGWLAEEVIDAFAVAEATAYIAGSGVKQPLGLLSTTKVADASWAWGSLGYVVTGASGAFATAGAAVNQGDVLWTTIYRLKQGHRQNAAFMMNRGTIGVCRTLKDGEGRWIWADARDGAPAMLCGYPTIEAEQMPDIAANSYSIAFGDFKRGYIIVDRVGMSVLRDPYSAKPYIEFYTRKRVGGGVQNYEAIKLIKFGTS